MSRLREKLNLDDDCRIEPGYMTKAVGFDESAWETYENLLDFEDGVAIFTDVMEALGVDRDFIDGWAIEGDVIDGSDRSVVLFHSPIR